MKNMSIEHITRVQCSFLCVPVAARDATHAKRNRICDLRACLQERMLALREARVTTLVRYQYG